MNSFSTWQWLRSFTKLSMAKSFHSTRQHAGMLAIATNIQQEIDSRTK